MENMSLNVRIGPNEVIIQEGRASIIIPNPDHFRRPDGVVEPAWLPVFYNPLMKTNRDITILIIRKTGVKGFFVEALGGTGVRGIRIALEAGLDGIVNDVDPLAHYYIRRNILLNGLADRVEPYFHEANSLLNSLTFTGIPVDYLDIDPYGSPIPYIDSAVRPLGRRSVLGVTATDTGPLTCSYPGKMLRRYGTGCVDTDFSKELGLRVLIYNLVFRAAGQGVGLKPILAYNHKYYYRVFFRSTRSAMESRRIMEECKGFIWYCMDDYNRLILRDPIGVELPRCRRPYLLGPLWICRLGDPSVAAAIAEEKNEDYRDALILAKHLSEEMGIVQPYFRYDKLFGLFRKNMPPINELLDRLRNIGFKAVRTHFDPRGVKTNAPMKEVYRIISSWPS